MALTILAHFCLKMFCNKCRISCMNNQIVIKEAVLMQNVHQDFCGHNKINSKKVSRRF